MAVKLSDDENTLTVDDRKFKAVPTQFCKNCQFGKQKDTKFCGLAPCLPYERKDGVGISWIEVVQ